MTDEELCIKFLTSDVWEDVRIGISLYKDEYLGRPYSELLHNILRINNGKIFIGMHNWMASECNKKHNNSIIHEIEGGDDEIMTLFL